MRHRKKKGKINRNISHRKAMLKNMTNSLFTHQRIETTVGKAKALRSFAEPLITLAKKDADSVLARRQVFQKLCSRDVVRILFDELAPLYKDVSGGYTRIMPLDSRKGDGARMVIMELTKRTVSDEDLLGVSRRKEAVKKKKVKEEEKEKAPPHVAPEVAVEEKEEHTVEEAKKEKAKTEQKKITKRGIFKRFRRKSMG